MRFTGLRSGEQGGRATRVIVPRHDGQFYIGRLIVRPICGCRHALRGPFKPSYRLSMIAADLRSVIARVWPRVAFVFGSSRCGPFPLRATGYGVPLPS